MYFFSVFYITNVFIFIFAVYNLFTNQRATALYNAF